MAADEMGPSPRLCIMHQWAHFDGYGFNLHAETDKPGQYIGKVDADSPAEAAGMKEGDRIVEVNGVNVQGEDHTEVVARIKSQPSKVEMLLIDPAGAEYYRERGITVTGDMPNVIVGEAQYSVEVKSGENTDLKRGVWLR